MIEQGKNDLKAQYIHPLDIGSIHLSNNLALAPMAGVCDLPFRVIAKEMGAGLVCMEMVSAKAILFKNKKTHKMMEADATEHPVSLQLFGSEPDIMAEAARAIDHLDFDILDINMGCPVQKVVGNGEGSALLLDLKLAGDIIHSVSKATSKPLMVKFRIGFDDSHIVCEEMARICEANGANAITIHGRTREQFYRGKANWDEIAKAKRAVSIPVFGNGDIKDASDVIKIHELTGCDGYMIARASQGNPWVFRDILKYFETGEEYGKVSAAELRDMMIRHVNDLIAYRGDEVYAIKEFRKQAAWYTAGYKGAAKLRGRLLSVGSLEELEQLTLELL